MHLLVLILKNRIGANRIVFNSYLNEKYVPVHELVTIITTKGVLVCYIINSIGKCLVKIVINI